MSLRMHMVGTTSARACSFSRRPGGGQALCFKITVYPWADGTTIPISLTHLEAVTCLCSIRRWRLSLRTSPSAAC